MQEKLSKLKYKFKTEVKSGKSGYMLYAAVLAGIFCIAVLKTGGKEQSQTQTIVRPDYTDSADNIELEVLAEGEEKPFLVELEVSPRQYDAQQIEGIFDTVYEQILQEMVSGNESLSCVRQNLKLVTESQDYPVTAEWYSEDTAVIDTDGTVYNTEFVSVHLQFLSAFVLPYHTVLPIQLPLSDIHTGTPRILISELTGLFLFVPAQILYCTRFRLYQ